MLKRFVAVYWNVSRSSSHSPFLKLTALVSDVKGFEYAAQPNVTEAEKSAKLHFAVVGGGPTVSKDHPVVPLPNPASP